MYKPKLKNVKSPWIKGARIGLWIAETLWILSMVLAFWHHSPPIRDEWVGLLLGAIPIYTIRFILYGRLWTRTPLDILLIGFLALTYFNYYGIELLGIEGAPFRRADYIVVVCRPLHGVFVYLYCVEYGRIFKRLDGLLAAVLLLGFNIAVLGLTATQFIGKSDAFAFIIDAIPDLNLKSILPDMYLSFNSNEIGGALAWMVPMLAGLVLYHWQIEPIRWIRQRFDTATEPSSTRIQLMQLVAAIVFVGLFLALLLGQSRYAFGGVVVGLFILIILLIKKPLWRYGLLTLLTLVLLLEVAVLFNILPLDTTPAEQASGTTATETAQAQLSERDQTTFTTRFQIWESGFKMMRDYPLTGIGFSMFRSVVIRDPYIVPHYADRDSGPPHAHNEFVEMAAGMGLPGLLIFIGWYLVAGWMLQQSWRNGSENYKIVTVAVACGLLAHLLYGMGDTISLWDRFYFVFWVLLGVVGANYVQVRKNQQILNQDLAD